MEGDIAEDFILKDQFGKEFVLYENLQTKILLVFYPKDDTFICSRQLKDYSNNIEIFNKSNIKVVAINPGSTDSHANFCSKLNLKINLLSDINKTVCIKFNAVNAFGAIKRKLVLIGTDKNILFEKSFFSLLYFNTERVLKEISN